MPETNQKNNDAHFSKSKATYERNPEKKSEKKYGAKFSNTLLFTTFPYYCTKQSNFYTLSQARTTPSEHSKQHVL
jgi:hypothetical protein